MNIFKRKAQYYETDQMGIIHHSNYIRWFEEARIYFMEQNGLGYDESEKRGIRIPVLSVNCNYKMPVKFADEVFIETKIEEFNGVRMSISYKVISAATNEIHATGETRHCFVDMSYRPVHLKKSFPELYDLFSGMIE